MNYLSEVTGKKFTIDPANNFIEYSIRMRMGKYDMLFDGPHLTGWRMVNAGYTPVVRLPGEIQVVVVTLKDSNLSEIKDLEQGHAKVCAFASPNMLTMAFLSHFPHPARQPLMLRTQGFKELWNCLETRRGQAAVLRAKLWKKLKDEDKGKFKLIATPQRSYPERTISVSGKIGPELRKQISDALLSEEGKKVSQALLARFKKENFIAASANDYDGLDKLLSSVWGFHTR